MPARGELESRAREVKSSGSSRGAPTGSNFSSTNSFGIDEAESQWTSWLVPMFVVANVSVFVVVMYANNCPKHSSNCVVDFLGRFSFETLRENPLFGPSART